MTQEEIVITVVRILGSLVVLRWVFVGGWIAVFIDLSDLFLMNTLDLGGVRNYQALDKWLDLVYMVTFLAVALRWLSLERNIAVSLFIFRLCGMAAFEITGTRELLPFFPNVFEFWFLFVAGAHLFKPDYEITLRRAVIWLLPLTALKEFQEYVLHTGKWLDGFTALEAVENIWGFLTAWL